MQIAIVENNQIKQIGELNQLFPNSSFPAAGPASDWLQENNVVLVDNQKQYDSNTQKLVSVDPYIENGKVSTVAVVNRTQEEIDERTVAIAKQVRSERDRLLTQSDWTQLQDAPVDKAAWATYRQALRDITSQPGFPLNVQFPDQP